MKKSVIGIVETQIQAERVVDQLQQQGVSTGDVSVLFPDKRGSKDFAHEHNTKAPEGAVAGVGAGGVVGGTLGLLAGIGALAIPGVGPLIAAGPLMAALSGAAAGATVGGIAGGLIGLGIPEYEAKTYEGKIRNGNILIAVHTDNGDAEKRAKQILESNGAHDIAVTGDSSVPKKSEQVSRF
ncbi:MAG TPA: general stress protein [Polyangiaceae bacterium]|nr:general stress protein [Polyangiaceae bacterium]